LLSCSRTPQLAIARIWGEEWQGNGIGIWEAWEKEIEKGKGHRNRRRGVREMIHMKERNFNWTNKRKPQKSNDSKRREGDKDMKEVKEMRRRNILFEFCTAMIMRSTVV
jgi:hypothetical protein